MKTKNLLYLACLLLGTLFVFCYFWTISNLTPLAGDDWGYALNGMSGNPFVTLLDFYQSWSGRLVAEFWGLVVAPRKELWNVLNAFLFSGIYFLLMKIGNCGKKTGAVGLLLFLIFSVSEYLRMETYTWIMGTTYVIPLFMSLLIFAMIEKNVFDAAGMPLWKTGFVSVISLFIGVSMENIAAMMIVAYVLILGYTFVCYRAFRKDFLVPLLCSISGFLIMRLSPGSTFRTLRDHSQWLELSLFEKIEGQLSNFFRYTFIENKYLIFILGLICLLALVMKGKDWILKHKSVSTVLFISQCTAVFFSCANVLASRIHMLSALVNPASLVVRIWWIVYVVLTFVTLFYLIEQHHQRMKAFFLLMMGGGCNLIMLYSPIFGSRSSLYFVFFLFGIILILYSQLETETDWLDWAVTVVFCGLVFMRASNWMIKYQQVHEIQIIREAEIKY